MRLLSCFADETGQQDMGAGYYMLTLVFNDQADELAPLIDAYDSRLALEGLPDIAFHNVELVHGHGDYEGVSVETRKRLLVAFSMFVRTLPVRYHTFKYGAADAASREALATRMRRDIVNFLFDHLGHFQLFDRVPIYYDGGHEAVTQALHGAFDFAPARSAAEYKSLSYQEKRLAQAADYLCSIELAAMRYEAGTVSPTYERFYGSPRKFKQNYLKQARRKLVE